MYLHTVRVELSLMHETILRVDIVATDVAWESVFAASKSTLDWRAVGTWIG